MAMIFLETDRMLFQTHEARDEADFVAMHTDPEVRRYVGGQAWPMEKAVHRFRELYLGQPTATYGLWAVVLKEKGKYIGCCRLRAPGSRLQETRWEPISPIISRVLIGGEVWPRKHRKRF